MFSSSSQNVSATCTNFGVQEGTRSALQGSVYIDKKYSLTQTVAQGSAAHLQSSIWNLRGWTFQERLLSRRVLIFIAEQIFWNCDSGSYCEETTLEIEKEKEKETIYVSSRALDCHHEFDDGVEEFSREAQESYVTQYSTRDFTYESDALAAFLGILRRMECRNSEVYHWGLPQTRFDQALCWRYGSKPREVACRIQAEDGFVSQIPPTQPSQCCGDGTGQSFSIPAHSCIILAVAGKYLY